MGRSTGWRWTKPFGVDRQGLKCVEVCAADKQPANLYVKVEKSGGCQLMVRKWCVCVVCMLCMCVWEGCVGGGGGECGWGVSVYCAWTDILCTNVLQLSTGYLPLATSTLSHVMQLSVLVLEMMCLSSFR